MRKIWFLFSVAILLTGCEDKQKTKEEKREDVTKISEVKIDEKQIVDDAPIVKITNANVVQFLTDYGEKNPETKVQITTRIGEIVIELYKDTPLHRANFIYLVKQGYFDVTFFHRVVPNFIIQGGNSDIRETNKMRYTLGQEYLVPAEIKHSHSYGSVVGAKEYRENPDKNTAPYEFFIFFGPPASKVHLEGNYTVFGTVISGMDVVEKIANLPAEIDEWPQQNVYIKAQVLE